MKDEHEEKHMMYKMSDYEPDPKNIVVAIFAGGLIALFLWLMWYL